MFLDSDVFRSDLFPPPSADVVASPRLCPGGGGPGGDVLDRPRPPAVPADRQAAGADGLRDAGDLLRGAEEGGALPGGGRAARAGPVVLADPGPVLQRGARPLHALRVRTLPAARQHGRHLPEVPDHEGGSGESSTSPLSPVLCPRAQADCGLSPRQPYDSLPTSQTCFFQLRLPPYSSQAVMAERLRYAINNCRSIDMDNYMLSRNVDNAEGSDTDY